MRGYLVVYFDHGSLGCVYHRIGDVWSYVVSRILQKIETFILIDN